MYPCLKNNRNIIVKGFTKGSCPSFPVKCHHAVMAFKILSKFGLMAPF